MCHTEIAVDHAGLLLAVEQAADGVVITDTGGTIQYVNRAFTAMTGYSREEALGKNPRILKSGCQPATFYANLWQTIQSGQIWVGQIRNRRRDGSVYLESVRIAPIRGESGIISGYIATKHDLTEERASEEKSAFLASIVEHSQDAIVACTPAGMILTFNQAAERMFGYPAAHVLGLPVSILVPSERQTALKDVIDKLLNGGIVSEYEGRCLRKDGSVFCVSGTGSVIRSPGGEVVAVSNIIRDISDRRQLENDLRMAQKLEAIGQLAAGIAHEINTPTQFILDNLTFLQNSWDSVIRLLFLYRSAYRDSPTPRLDPGAKVSEAESACDLEFVGDEFPKAIAQSIDGAQRVAKLVRAMKEFSHPDSAEMVEIDLNKSIASTITVARNEWKYVAVMDVELDEGLPSVLCFPGDINQVFLNLIVNAAHAIKEKVKENEKGRIVVRTARRGEHVEVSVTDTGAGIPEEIRGRIFEPFFTTKEVGKGTGQGLSFAHGLVVKKHRGKIWFETQVGQGTTFFVQLPIH